MSTEQTGAYPVASQAGEQVIEPFKGPLSGHGLLFEGRVSTFHGYGTGPGRGRCQCGAQSESLPTTAARQRWHRLHKAEVAC